MENIEEIRKFIEKRPNVKGAYGYGSGVFKQNGYTTKDKPQIDLILVVDNLKDWHLQNIKLNPRDYSFTGKLFFKKASSAQMKKSTGITYLSNIHEDGKVYKYGTIEENDLIHYLQTWESFYLPGRFQKPYLPIIEDKKLSDKMEENREKASMTALLTLEGKNDNLMNLFTAIGGLSYLGDTRMRFAENPHKVSNIVKGSYDYFQQHYDFNQYYKTDLDGNIEIRYEELKADISKLPESLREYIINNTNIEDLNEIRNAIIEYFTNLNKKESLEQTIKGIYTNGVIRSVKYASKKIMKKIKN